MTILHSCIFTNVFAKSSAELTHRTVCGAGARVGRPGLPGAGAAGDAPPAAPHPHHAEGAPAVPSQEYLTSLKCHSGVHENSCTAGAPPIASQHAIVSHDISQPSSQPLGPAASHLVPASPSVRRGLPSQHPKNWLEPRIMHGLDSVDVMHDVIQPIIIQKVSVTGHSAVYLVDRRP